MPQKGQGQYQKSGLSSVRRDWNVLKAVRRYRGTAAPTWTQYLAGTNRGRTQYRGKA